MDKKCELCDMQATQLKIDETGLVHYYCDHHAPAGSTKIGKVTKKNPIQVYWPLGVVLLLIILYILMRARVTGNTGLESIVNDFMAGFFGLFGILQLLTRKATAEALKKYDPIAYRYPVYASMYPFIFLFFGLALHFHSLEVQISAVTIAILTAQTYGIIKVLKRKEEVVCACIGTKYTLPLSWVTVGENVLMILMSIYMIIASF